MTNRILDFSQTPARLRLDCGCLVAETSNTILTRVALTDIESIVLSHPQISVSQALLGALASCGITVVFCDEKLRPAGMMLPLEGHQAQRARFRAQAALSTPRRKRLWQEIVQAKIRAQAATLEEFLGEDAGLREMAKRVGSGDPNNHEAQAARRYWPLLFPDNGFRRRDEMDARNHVLNYGYAILRAAVARALCGAGLHPSFELHHRSPYNTFPLADDVMEPFRPAIDRAVRLESDRRARDGQELGVDAESKKAVISALIARYRAGSESRTLLDLLTRSAQTLVTAVLDPKCSYTIPDWKVDLRKDVASAIQDNVDSRNVRSAGRH